MAIFPPADVLDQIAALPWPEGRLLRSTERGQWHVTLRFLGHARVDHALAALQSIAPLRQCDATVGPAVERLWEHVVALPVHGTDELASAVDAGLTDAGVGEPIERRSYVGHLTLARIRPHEVVRSALIGHPFSASFPVTSIALVRSELSRQGPRYGVVGSRAVR